MGDAEMGCQEGVDQVTHDMRYIQTPDNKCAGYR